MTSAEELTHHDHPLRKSGLVAIAGRPNAGKSTLMNRVVGGELSIVTSKAQTTRDQVKGILTADPGQIVFVDTPGIHRARKGGINEYMVRTARQALDRPDAVWYLIDPASTIEHEEPALQSVEAAGAPVLLVMNKADLGGEGRAGRRREFLDELSGELGAAGVEVAGAFEVSALRGRGVDELLTRTWELLPAGPFLYPDEEMLSDRPSRYFVAEMVREQLFRRLGDELPYSCAVRIDRFAESVRPVRIEATIVVERESQKGMVIGRGGRKIKEIGQHARGRIEVFLGGKVFLGLQVDVVPGWTRNADAMKKMGYFIE